MEETITKKYKILTIIAGILTLIPVLSIIYNLIGVTNEKLYTISFYGLKIVGLVIYIFISKKIKVRRIIYVVLAILSLLVSILMVNSMSGVSGGLDALGEALAYALLVKFSLYSYYIFAFLLYMSYAKKFIFKKNAIIRAVIVLLLALAVYGIIQLIKVDRVKEDLLPTVGDFKNELASRGLCNGECYTSDSIKLYGIKKGLEKADDLDFYSDSNKKYPLYVYATEETLHETNWLIYY